MSYIVEYLKDSYLKDSTKWTRSANTATRGEFSTYDAAFKALKANTHYVAGIYRFRVRELKQEIGVIMSTSSTWVQRPELVCPKCGQAGKIKLWLPWNNSPDNYVSHQCDNCWGNWRDDAAMLALYGSVSGSSIPAPSAGGKEEQVFQVTTYNFASATVSNLQFDRLCAARENLEKQVAGFRSAGVGQAKTFFTASILDTKTGKYHGFVSDAPPAVELKGGE